MSFAAKVVADSLAPNGVRLSTLTLTYPRFVHAEFLTHRAFSRNASSSRAIPVRRQLSALRGDMAVPVHMGRAQKGMQADTELCGWRRAAAMGLWRGSGYLMAAVASLMGRLGVHKQVANRVTEPWSHITVVCTATDFEGFFGLRCHPMAQPEIRRLAEKMRAALAASTPVRVGANGWHLPFVSAQEQGDQAHVWRHWVRLSVARCARVSYLTHDGSKPSAEADLNLYRRLMGAQPAHASPAEHQACAVAWMGPDCRSGNLRGWQQYRQRALPAVAAGLGASGLKDTKLRLSNA